MKYTHILTRECSVSVLGKWFSSFVSSALGELDLLTEVMVPFPMEILAPGHAVEDETAPETAVDIGVRIALGACTLVMSLRRKFVQFDRW